MFPGLLLLGLVGTDLACSGVFCMCCSFDFEGLVCIYLPLECCIYVVEVTGGRVELGVES